MVVLCSYCPELRAGFFGDSGTYRLFGLGRYLRFNLFHPPVVDAVFNRDVEKTVYQQKTVSFQLESNVNLVSCSIENLSFECDQHSTITLKTKALATILCEVAISRNDQENCYSFCKYPPRRDEVIS